MSQLDPSVYRRRRLSALAALIVVIVAIWGIPQLFAGSGQEVLPVEETQSAEPSPAEITECAPGVVSVEAKIGRLVSQNEAGTEMEWETLNSFGSDTDAYLWYELTNNGLVDCVFNVGARVTFFTITSGEQTFWSSRDCDRAGLTDSYYTMKPNETVSSEPSLWEKSYSSENGCNASGNSLVPTGGATFRVKAEVNGVISEDTRFILN